MHTFRKSGEQYDVGLWLRSPHPIEDYAIDQFEPLVVVSTLRGAIRLTNLLNGGTGNIDATLLRAGVMERPGDGDNHGEDHESTAKRAAVVRRARARAPARHAV